MAWHGIRNGVVMPTRPGCLCNQIEFLSAGASDRVDGCSRHRLHLSVFASAIVTAVKSPFQVDKFK